MIRMVECIFCEEAFDRISLLKTHSANCAKHPAVMERDSLKAEIAGAHESRSDSCAEAERRIDALKAFKAYVHKRLDDAGVPVDPPSPHREAGCRIGGRLDALLWEINSMHEALELTLAAPGFPECDRRCDSKIGGVESSGLCDCGAQEVREQHDKARAILAAGKAFGR